MNRLPHLFVIALLSLVTTGCDVGVGGTGTGRPTEYLADFGATAQSPCGAAFTAGLGCVTGSQVNSLDPFTRLAKVTYGDDSGRIQLTFEDNSGVLNAPCLGLQFDGVWGTAPATGARFYGGLASTAAPARAPAQLDVAAVGDSAGTLRIVLLALDGHVVLGPIDVRRLASPPQTIDCR